MAAAYALGRPKVAATLAGVAIAAALVASILLLGYVGIRAGRGAIRSKAAPICSNLLVIRP